MKRLYITATLLLIVAANSFAQQTRLNLYGNYAFDDKVDSYYSNTSYFSGKIKGGFYGVPALSSGCSMITVLSYLITVWIPKHPQNIIAMA